MTDRSCIILILARIFTFPQCHRTAQGQAPRFFKGGIPLRFNHPRRRDRDGKLTLKEFIIDGRQVDLIASGEVDLANQRIDVKVLVAPFKTVDCSCQAHSPGELRFRRESHHCAGQGFR